MNKTYFLKEAFTLNATGQKVNAIATPAVMEEVKAQKLHFDFNFYSLFTNYIIYKLADENRPEIIQGLVAFRHQVGFLECKNMETNIHNRNKTSIYNHTGKAMVALCCKYSLDNNMDGYISFESKGRLKAYYLRLGAKELTSVRMYIDTENAKKLINFYF